MYNNISRQGLRSSTSVKPASLAEDISLKIHRLRPQSTPMDTLFRIAGRGPKPINHKVTTTQYHEFDPIDSVSSVVMCSTITTGWEMFARLRLDQLSRPETNSSIWYQPGDKLYILKTGQTVQIWVTPDASIDMTDTTFFADGVAGAITGGTATTTAAGWVLVKNTEKAPLIPFTISDTVYLGNQLRESSKILTRGHQRDVIYDFNYVEHKDATLQMTEDQAEWVKTRFTMPDWSFQQEETLAEFKLSVDRNLLFSKRSINSRDRSKADRSMRGLIDHIQSNVAFYNPQSVFNFETLMQNFMQEQAFRYNRNGKPKYAMCGGGFLALFNQTFQSQRRIGQLAEGGIGLNLESYDFIGNTLNLTRTDVFAQGTPMWFWCVVVDPEEAEMRLVKDYEVRTDYQNNDERDKKFMVEWQGTVAWNIEQSHSLLRTF